MSSVTRGTEGPGAAPWLPRALGLQTQVPDSLGEVHGRRQLSSKCTGSTLNPEAYAAFETGKTGHDSNSIYFPDTIKPEHNLTLKEMKHGK